MKDFNVAEWSIKHVQIVFFFILAILVGGLWSYFNLGRSEDPNFTIRTMVITVAWPGASPVHFLLPIHWAGWIVWLLP